MTGQATDASDVAAARKAVPEGFILVGSGVTETNAPGLLAHADGAIVGTSLKRDGVVSNPIELDRVKRLARIFGATGQ